MQGIGRSPLIRLREFLQQPLQVFRPLAANRHQLVAVCFNDTEIHFRELIGLLPLRQVWLRQRWQEDQFKSAN
jgi:hypothetical protein